MEDPAKFGRFLLRRRAGLSWLEASNLNQFPWLVHAFSTRVAGSGGSSLDLGTHSSRQPREVAENRRRFFRQLRVENFAIVSLKQVHSVQVWQVRALRRGRLEYLPAGFSLHAEAHSADREGDALVTDQPAVLLSVRTADCLPVLIVDPRRRAVAAVHAGWRGLLKRIVEKTVERMHGVFGSEPRDLVAALGPSIRACCYEVGPEVVGAFHEQFPQADKFFHRRSAAAAPEAANHPTPMKAGLPSLSRRGIRGASAMGTSPLKHERPEGWHLDLIAAALGQFASAGVRKSPVQVADYCTACRSDLFFSYRRDGSAAGRMMAVIGLRAPSTSN